MKRKVFLLSLLLLLLLVQGVQAMESVNFGLNWFTPLDSSGGSPARSAHFAANYTIGQSAIGQSASSQYHAGLGYWYALIQQFRSFIQIDLPLVIR